MRKVSVVLNTFRRPEALKLQYEAVTTQTVIPPEVLLWKNHPEDETEFDFKGIDGVAIAQNNANYGVWARFAFALNTCSDYICVLDDDTDHYSRKKTVYSLSIPNFKDSKCGCDLECNCTTIDTPLARFPQHRKEMKACKFKSNRKALKHFQELGIYDDDEAGFGRGFAKEESK